MAHPLPIGRDTPARQAQGHPFSPSTWDGRVIQPSKWPSGNLWSNPEQIIKQFQQRHYTQAVAMVVSWGEMWRQPNAIWGPSRPLAHIEKTLAECADNIVKSNSISHSWDRLTGTVMSTTGQLAWSSVMASKTLHFLCRSLGFEQDPPVPIDGGVMRQRVWPFFRNSISKGYPPGNWNGDAFEVYSRYMSAIRTWANQRNWTTTQMEVTIFDHFERRT